MDPQDPQNPPQNTPPAQQPTDQQQADTAAEVIKFVDELINQKFTDHQDQLTPEVRDELRQDLLIRLDDFIMAKVIAALSDEDLATFENMMKEGKSREELQQFATQRIPEFTDFATDAFLEFRTIYLSNEEQEEE